MMDKELKLELQAVAEKEADEFFHTAADWYKDNNLLAEYIRHFTNKLSELRGEL